MSKILLKEVRRMAELINYGQKDTKIVISENKILLKEEDEDIVDLFDKEDVLNTKTSKDLPFQLKVAILAHNLDQYHAAVYNLYTKYEPETKKITPPSDETVYQKLASRKMSRSDYEEYEKMKSRGRVVIPYTENLSKEEQDYASRWLRKKDYNIISYNATQGTVTELGKQTLNFLGRFLANKPKDEQEKLLLSSTYTPAFINTAKGILLSFFSRAIPNVIKSKIHKTNLSVRDEEIIEEGIFKALNAIEKGLYDESKGDLGSFMIEIVKNSFYDYLRKTAPYILDTSKVYDELDARMTSDPKHLIRIKSRLNPGRSDVSNVKDVIEIPPSKSYSHGLYEYIYDSLSKAVEDFGKKHTERTIIPVPHLQQHWLPAFEIVKFYSPVRRGGEISTRKEQFETPSYEFIPDAEEIIDVIGEKKVKLEKEAENQIKALLEYVIDTMLESTSIRKEKIKKEAVSLEEKLKQLKSTNNPEAKEVEETLEALKMATSFSWGKRDKEINDLLANKEGEISGLKDQLSVATDAITRKELLIKTQKAEKELNILNKTKDFITRQYYVEPMPKEFLEGKSRKLFADFLYGLLQSDKPLETYRDEFNQETLKQYKEKSTPEEIAGKNDEMLIAELRNLNLWIPDVDRKVVFEIKSHLQKFFSQPVEYKPSKFDDQFLVKKFDSLQKKLLNREEIFDIIRALIQKHAPEPELSTRTFEEQRSVDNLRKFVRTILSECFEDKQMNEQAANISSDLIEPGQAVEYTMPCGQNVCIESGIVVRKEPSRDNLAPKIIIKNSYTKNLDTVDDTSVTKIIKQN